MLEGESLIGYVHRFYEANGLKVPSEVWSIVTNLSTIKTQSQSVQEALYCLIGKEVSLKEHDFFSQYLLSKKHITLAHRYLALHRFCPTCVNENSSHYSLWDLSMFTACPLHGCKLAYFSEQSKYNLKDSNIYPASEFEIQISKIILNAMDIPKTPLYFECVDQKPPSNYVLKDFFDALIWSSKFRKVIKSFGNRKPSKLTVHSVRPSDLGLTDYMFLLKTPTHEHRKKIIKKLSNQHQQFVNHLNGFNNLNILCIECTYLIAYDNPFTRQLIPIFQIFIKEYLNQLELKLTVYLNTTSHAISKPFSLLQFYEWWKQVMYLSASFKKSPKKDEIKITHFRGSIEGAIEAIFRQLIQASQHDGSEFVYANLFKGWDFPDPLKRPCGIEKILINLRSYLKNLHPYDLLVFHDLLNITDQSAKEEMYCLMF